MTHINNRLDFANYPIILQENLLMNNSTLDFSTPVNSSPEFASPLDNTTPDNMTENSPMLGSQETLQVTILNQISFLLHKNPQTTLPQATPLLPSSPGLLPLGYFPRATSSRPLPPGCFSPIYYPRTTSS